MGGRRTMAAVAVALVLLGGAGYLLSREMASPEGFRIRPDVTEEVFARDVPPGKPIFYSYVNLVPVGDRPVRIRSVELVGLPPEVEVLGPWAGYVPEGAERRIMSSRQNIFEEQPREAYHPVQDAVFLPGRKIQDWFLMLALRATEAGEYRADHWKVEYEVGGRTGTQILPRAIGFEVVAG